MKISVEGQNYVIRFSYDKPFTIASIKVSGAEKPFMKAKSECSKNDVFTKIRGRKLALERLIEKVSHNRDERREIWKQVLEQMRV